MTKTIMIIKDFNYKGIEIRFTLAKDSWRYVFEYKKKRYSEGIKNVIVQLTDDQIQTMARKAINDVIKKESSRV